ncbi:MAG TPA: pyridine nucleotide-disulfide oxidoreductase [Desulfobulbaceae bacterium]|nr:pyridine nucleotide-disulfide oxidoreductase [Desulfobulbaceae bacterium]
MSKQHLVLIGGGHAHLLTLTNIRTLVDKGYRVTVIQPSQYHYYSGMGPGMLGGTYTAKQIRFQTRKMVEQQGGRFILDRVTAIAPEKGSVTLKLTGERVPYDVLSCNAGSYVPSNGITGNNSNIFTVKPIELLLAARERIIALSEHGTIRVAVIGGGPSSVEVAGNVWRLGYDHCEYQPEMTLIAGSQLLGRLNPKISNLARNSLQKRGIRIVEGKRITEINKQEIRFTSGETMQADIIFSAIGVRPSRIFTNSRLPTGPDGGLLVNRFLQSTGFENIFGGGDCISFAPEPLAKVGVYAVRQNPILVHNLTACLTGEPLQEFDPNGSNYLQIYNLGDNTGIFCKGSFVFSGRMAFLLKDYIDRRFMRTFQQSIS